jgi:hypothetical protein
MIGQHVRFQQQILLDLANHIRGKCHFPVPRPLLFINVTEDYGGNNAPERESASSGKYG